MKGTIKRKIKAISQKRNQRSSFLDMFKYTTRQEKILTSLGIISAAINGLPFPIMLLVYGDTIDKFVTTHFCDAYKWYNVSSLCPPNVNEGNINQEFFKCNWTGTNISIPYYTDTISRDAVIYTIIGIIVWIFYWLQTTLLAYSGEKIVKNMRIKLLYSILEKPISWYDRNDSGTINNYMTDTMNKFKQGIGDKVGMIVQAVITTVASVVLILSLDWKLSVVVLSLSPLFIISARYMAGGTMSFTDDEILAYEKASSIAQQTFANIKTVNAFNGHNAVQEKYDENLNSARIKATKKGFINGFMLSIIWLVLFSSQALAFWYGHVRMIDGLTVGTILIIIFGMQIAVFTIGTCVPHYQAINDARAASTTILNIIERTSENEKESISSMFGRPKSTFFNEPSLVVKDVIDDNDKIVKNKNLLPMPKQFSRIKFDNVSFAYPSRPDVNVLQNVTFEIPSGKTVALVGESGSGKSTIAQLILGFYNLQEGRILIDDITTDSIDLADLRSSIGLVSQEPCLFSTTIGENIRMGYMDASDDQIEKVCEIANALSFINTFPERFDTMVGQSGSQLSGGQKQRIAIARAMISDPPILLLDEATSALDSESEKLVQIALDEASRGRTTIIIAHRLSTIRNADIIIGMARGRVVEMGTHDDLMKENGVYASLVNAQSEQKEEEFDDTSHDVKITTRRHLTSVGQTIDEELVEQEPDTKSVFLNLMRMNSPETLFIIVGCVCCVVFGVIQILFEYYFARILFVYAHCNDELRKKQITTQSLRFVWLAIGCALSQLLSSGAFTISGEKLTQRLRQGVFKSIVNQPIEFFDKESNSVGTLCTLLSTEASAVQGITGVRIGTVLSAISILLTGIIFAFIVGWKLALVILTMIPLMILSGIMEIKIMAGFDAGDKEYLQSASTSIIESTTNIRIVKQLRQEKYFLNKYIENVELICKRNLKRSIVTGLLFGFTQGVVFFCVAATYYAGARFVDKGYLTTEDMMLVFGTLLFGAMSVGNSQAMAPDFGKAFSAAKNIYSILNRKTQNTEGIIPNSFQGHIRMKNVFFNYPNRKLVKVLKGIDFELFKNNKVALVGTSGCGKSTIIQLIQRFYTPNKGQILLDNVDINDIDLTWYRKQMGIVSQEPILFDWSIAENIAFGDTSRQIPMDEIQNAAKAANIHKFIDQLPEGYETSVGTKGSLISGGQKQRICIARALLRNPPILLLDEATSALDTESEKVVQMAIDNASKDRSSVTIAHRLTTIQNSDKIYVLDNGYVTETGTHNELIDQKGLYLNIYNLSKR